MKKIIFIILLASALILTSCSKATESTGTKAEKQVKAKAEKEEMTVEKYCDFYKDYYRMLMVKYWPNFKGKEYSEVKDLYSNFLNEEEALYKRHNVEYNDLASFFRKNFKEVEEYNKNDEDYKDYPEKQEAKETLMKYAIAKSDGK